jgi:dipeptidase E
MRSSRRGGVSHIPNALDGLSSDVRVAGLERDIDELSHLGLHVVETDLRDPGAVDQLKQAEIVWVRGGNVFVLRRVLADSGLDSLLVEMIRENLILYGGYSAGACVLAPTLAGLEMIDDIGAVAEPVTNGLGVLDRPFVPHVHSPGHPETERCDALDATLTSAGQAHWALRDGEVLLVDEGTTELIS